MSGTEVAEVAEVEVPAPRSGTEVPRSPRSEPAATHPEGWPGCREPRPGLLQTSATPTRRGSGRTTRRTTGSGAGTGISGRSLPSGDDERMIEAHLAGRGTDGF
jgi:hypothetical protein